MFEEQRRCACCGRVPAWSEIVVNTSDQKKICLDCIRKANLPDPPANSNSIVHPWVSTQFLERVYAHNKYDAYCNMAGTKKMLGGYLLVNENDKTFAIGSNDYKDMLIGFQSASYSNVDSISITDGINTKSIKISNGDSGAADALFGGILFGTVGAIAGGLAGRRDAEYTEIRQTDNIGFTINYLNSSHEYFNVLQLCMNYDFVNYDTQKSEYDEAKRITVSICEELNKLITKNQPKRISGNSTSDIASSANVKVSINTDNIVPTLNRIEMYIEDGEWEKANQYCESALDYFTDEYKIYLYSLFANYRVADLDELLKAVDINELEKDSRYKRVLRFADEEFKNILKEKVSLAKKETQAKEESGLKIVAENNNVDNSSQKEELVKNYYTMAKACLDSNDKIGANNYCNKILEIDINNYRAWVIKAKLAVNTSSIDEINFEQAISAANKAVEMAADNIKYDVSEDIYYSIKNAIIVLLDRAKSLSMMMATNWCRLVMSKWLSALRNIPYLSKDLIEKEIQSVEDLVNESASGFMPSSRYLYASSVGGGKYVQTFKEQLADKIAAEGEREESFRAKAKAEADKKREAYWLTHPDLKSELDEKKAKAEATIKELNEEVESIPEKKEMMLLQEQRDAISAEYDNLGIFKMKEKKELQAKADDIYAKITNLKPVAEKKENLIQLQIAEQEEIIKMVEDQLNIEL